MAAMVRLDGLKHSFGSGVNRRQVLQDISLCVDPGEVVLLTGPSGCGKTTLLTLIGGRCRRARYRCLAKSSREQVAQPGSSCAAGSA
jgi:ABC-type lipoprotein export system ATPase subunit